MRRLLCAALLILTAPLYAAEPPNASAAISACIPRLDAELDVGFERIAARCPDLARALEQSDFAQWLPHGWKESRNNLSVGSLAELSALVAREQATRTAAHTPRVERLGEVLATLGNQHAQTPSAWSRFKQWLRGLTERAEVQDDRGWFNRMVGRMGISDAMLEVIQYVALGAMVLLALFVAFNELRAAGLLGSRKRQTLATDEQQAQEARALPALGDIERASPQHRPGMLLALICARLTSLRRLPPATAMTVRELTRSVDLQDAQDSEQLAGLALTAERVRYAEGGVPEASLDAAFANGRELLKRVETMGAPS